MLKDVIFFTNGNVMVFDEDGEQIPELQGFIMDITPKLISVCNEYTQFSYMEFRSGETLDCDFSWWFERGEDDG